jgi:hypothetical protein
MKPFNTFLAVAFGCVTAVLFGWNVDITAQSPADAIHVCAAEDGILRLAEGSTTCPAGQKSLYLAKPGAPTTKNAEQKADESQSESLQRRLANLEQRIKELEAAANRGELGNRVVAPFEVVDRAGKRIFAVEQPFGATLVSVFNRDSEAAGATIGATPQGGYFFAMSASDSHAELSALGSYSGVTVVENDVTRVDLGRDKGKGTYRLKFFTSAGKDVAGIGQSADTNGGLVVIQDAAGKTRAGMGITPDGKGAISVRNSSETTIAGLFEGSNKGGLLEIDSSSGQPMVEAGVEAEGFGVVRAGPEGFKPGVGILGLPGSYIAGKSK